MYVCTESYDEGGKEGKGGGGRGALECNKLFYKSSLKCGVREEDATYVVCTRRRIGDEEIDSGEFRCEDVRV